LADRLELTQSLLDLSAACARLRRWVRSAAPALAETFAVKDLTELPDMLARESARRWLSNRGAPPGELSIFVLDRFLTFARDAASPPRQHFPGGLPVRRGGGVISGVSRTE
jgi:hypothetical protein